VGNRPDHDSFAVLGWHFTMTSSEGLGELRWLPVSDPGCNFSHRQSVVGQKHGSTIHPEGC
jgi:hypothetical protein